MASNSKRFEAEDFVSCLECKNACAYYQWKKNPIVAQCSISNERQVAQTRRICKTFEPSYNEHPEIQHFNNYEESDYLLADLGKRE